MPWESCMLCEKSNQKYTNIRNQILNPKSCKNKGESEFNKVDNDRS